jgi:hypothetical protein
MQDYIFGMRKIIASLKSAGTEMPETAIISKLIHGLPKSFDSIIYSFEGRPEAEQTLDSLPNYLVRKETRDDASRESSVGQAVAMSHHTRNGQRKFNGSCYK